MAILWLSSGSGNDTNSGLTKALAKATWDGASGIESIIAAGDDLYVDDAHVETYAANWTMTFPGTLASPNRVITIDWVTEAYSASTIDNFISSTGDVIISGSVHFDGPRFKVTDDFSTGSTGNKVVLENGKLTLAGVGSVFSHGNSSGGAVTLLKKFDLDFTNGGDGFTTSGSGKLHWHGGVLSFTGTQPTQLLANGTRDAEIEFVGVDVSAITTVIISLSGAGRTIVRFVGGILSSSVTLVGATIVHPESYAEFIGSDDTTGNSLIRYHRTTYYGDITDDTGVYLSTSDGDGTTKFSRKMVSDANAVEYSEPLQTAWIQAWVDSTGSKTITIDFVHDSATALQDDEIAVLVAGHESSANTLLTFTDDKTADILATPADQASSSVTWTGTGGFTNENKQKIEVIKTINRVGYIYLQVLLFKPSKTVYFNVKTAIA